MTVFSRAETLISKSLQKHLGKFVNFPTLPVSYVGVNFTRPASGMWLEGKHFRAEPVQHGRDDEPSITYSGTFQVGVCDNAGLGELPATEIAAKVREHFKKGTVIDTLGIRVRITEQPSVGSSIQGDDKIVVPVRIQYSCSS